MPPGQKYRSLHRAELLLVHTCRDLSKMEKLGSADEEDGSCNTFVSSEGEVMEVMRQLPIADCQLSMTDVHIHCGRAASVLGMHAGVRRSCAPTMDSAVATCGCTRTSTAACQATLSHWCAAAAATRLACLWGRKMGSQPVFCNHTDASVLSWRWCCSDLV